MSRPDFPDVSDVKGAKLKTNVGEIEVKLYADLVPKTVGNFVGLAEGSIPWRKRDGSPGSGPLYKGVVFHRIIRQFMLQGGDPDGTGTGGPGYQLRTSFTRVCGTIGPVSSRWPTQAREPMAASFLSPRCRRLTLTTAIRYLERWLRAWMWSKRLRPSRPTPETDR